MPKKIIFITILLLTTIVTTVYASDYVDPFKNPVPINFSEEKVNSIIQNSINDNKFVKRTVAEIDDGIIHFEGTLSIFIRQIDFSFSASIQTEQDERGLLSGMTVDISNLKVAKYDISDLKTSEKYMEDFANRMVRESFEDEMPFDITDIVLEDENIIVFIDLSKALQEK